MKTFKEIRTDLNDSDELNEGYVEQKLVGLIDKGISKVLDKIEKITGKHLGFVQKSTVPSSGKDSANDGLLGDRFKKEAEDFHRKAKKQWTWAKKELGKGFKFYGNGTQSQTPKYGDPAMRQIPADQKEFVKRLEVEMQKIIDMHTQLEKMMQTTGNSVKYQRTMEKLESDTNRVFKEISKAGDEDKAATYTSKYRAMQGMDNLKKAKKMTHKEPNQRSPAKFRAFANMGEENMKNFSEFRNELNELDEKDPKLAIKKAKESNNKKISPTKFLQPIIKRFPKHEDELRKHISTHVELDSPSDYAKLRKDINATLDKIAK